MAILVRALRGTMAASEFRYPRSGWGTERAVAILVGTSKALWHLGQGIKGLAAMGMTMAISAGALIGPGPS